MPLQLQNEQFSCSVEKIKKRKKKKSKILTGVAVILGAETEASLKIVST